MFTRRHLLQLSAGVAAGLALPAFAADAKGTRLILLGTQGGPNLNLRRSETSSLLVVDGVPYMIDCGYGALRGLVAADVSYLNVGHIFFTHLHDDHAADLVALLGHQWTQGRVQPTAVFGPWGTDSLVEASNHFNEINTEIRFVDEARTILPKDMFKGTVIKAGPKAVSVFSDERVKVTAIENTHYPEEAKAKMPHRALSYRFDTKDRSVVFSGDTAYSENLISLAKGADVLVCEAMDVAATRANFDARVKKGFYKDNPEGIWHHIEGTHTSTADAGRMAQAAGVKTLVLNHIIPGGLEDVSDSLYIKAASVAFKGKIVVGKDGMVL